jgi:hypothetical protein
MTWYEASGYLASSLVIAAFCMKDIVTLRSVALASNVAFLVYGLTAGLAPVWLLHTVLLPLNGWRLWQELPSSRVRRRERWQPTRRDTNRRYGS